MKCPRCNTDMIWGGDIDTEDADDRPMIESNLSCPECEVFVLIYCPVDDWSPVLQEDT